MVDFGESYKMIKISEKMTKSDTYKEFSNDISLFIEEFLQTHTYNIYIYIYIYNICVYVCVCVCVCVYKYH